MSENNTKSRFYLNIPAFAPDQIDAMQKLLDELTAGFDIACVNLPLDKNCGRDGFEGEQQLKHLFGGLQQKNIAVLSDMTSSLYAENRKSFEKALEIAVKMNVDGIHMSADDVLYARAREVLGHEVIIGVDCGLSRHLAMQLGEMGADYVAFRSTGANPENVEDLIKLVTWWQELFEVPCVASDIVDQAQIEALAQIRADFIALGPTHWSSLSSNKDVLSWLSANFPVQSEGC